MTTDHTPTAATAAPLELPTRTELGIPLNCPAGQAYPVVSKLFELLNEAGFKPKRVVDEEGEIEQTPDYALMMALVFDLELSSLRLRDPNGRPVWLMAMPCNAEDVISDYSINSEPLNNLMGDLYAWMEGEA